jgi:1,4-dihydroxy-2-naphthoyl-CoA hydrolase
VEKTFAFDLTLDQAARLQRGMQLLEAAEPYAAHEVFEAAFRAALGPNQTLFRGLTQLAASYHQLCLGRARGARSTLTKAFRNLQLVVPLSMEFQQRVEGLFSTLGAAEGCGRFVAATDPKTQVWPLPVPARLHAVHDATPEPGGIMGQEAGAPVNDGFNTALGLELVSTTLDEVVAQLVVGPQHHQPWGIVHGGVYCAIVETVCSVGGQVSLGTSGGFVVGVDNHTSFFKATRSGTLRATARPLSKSKRTQLWEANVHNENGELVASGRVRLMVVEAGKVLAGEVAAHKSDG